MPFSTLENILKPEYLTIHPDDNHTVVLTEPHNNKKTNSLKKVAITDLPSQSIILRLEPLGNSLFYEDGKIHNGHNVACYRCKCDYVVICTLEQKSYIFYIEMKSSNITSNAKYQLFRGQCIMEYLHFSMQTIENRNGLMDSFENRFVVLLKIPLEHETTSGKRDYIQSIQPSRSNTDINNIYPLDLSDRDSISIQELIYDPT